MKRMKWLLAGSALVLAGLVALMVFQNLQSRKPESVFEKPELPAILKSGDPFEKAKFSEIPFRIYQVDSISPKNILVSERALNQAVSLLLNMTSGNTEKELQTLFGLTLESQVTPASLNLSELGYEIENILKVKSKADLKRSFVERLEKNEYANIAQLKPEEMKTLGLGAGARLYVKQTLAASWKNSSVKEVPVLFRSSPYRSNTVTALAGQVEAKAYENENSEWLEIPLSAEPWAIGFGKAKEGKKLNEVENQLSQAFLENLSKHFGKAKKLEVSIPKLVLQQTYSIKNWFNLAGYNRFFSTDANYSKANAGKNGKWLDDVFEENTISISGTLNDQEAHLDGDDFQLNSPFIFYIRNMNTQEILLLGRYFGP